MVSIAALDYLNHPDLKSSVTTVYSFGSPRVGNQEWADFYKKAVDAAKTTLKNKGRIVHL